MAVKIRLKRFGRKKRPFYRIVVADESCARDGKYIEAIGYYNPISVPKDLKVNTERAVYWLKKGARPTDTCRTLLKKAGVKLNG